MAPWPLSKFDTQASASELLTHPEWCEFAHRSPFQFPLYLAQKNTSPIRTGPQWRSAWWVHRSWRPIPDDVDRQFVTLYSLADVFWLRLLPLLSVHLHCCLRFKKAWILLCKFLFLCQRKTSRTGLRDFLENCGHRFGVFTPRNYPSENWKLIFVKRAQTRLTM